MALRALTTALRIAPQRASTRLRGSLISCRAPWPLAPAFSRCLASSSADPSGQQPAEEEGSELFERGVARLDEGALPAAVQLFAQAAESGHAEGHFYLGLAYDGLLGEDARGELPVEKDAAAAARCYIRASEQGLPEAMLNLSLCYRLGEGLPRDTAAGFAWAERGAEVGRQVCMHAHRTAWYIYHARASQFRVSVALRCHAAREARLVGRGRGLWWAHGRAMEGEDSIRPRCGGDAAEMRF